MFPIGFLIFLLHILARDCDVDFFFPPISAAHIPSRHTAFLLTLIEPMARNSNSHEYKLLLLGDEGIG